MTESKQDIELQKFAGAIKSHCTNYGEPAPEFLLRIVDQIFEYGYGLGKKEIQKDVVGVIESIRKITNSLYEIQEKMK